MASLLKTAYLYSTALSIVSNRLSIMDIKSCKVVQMNQSFLQNLLKTIRRATEVDITLVKKTLYKVKSI